VLKEIFHFTQKNLDQRGVFLLDFVSEAFVWVGKKVGDQDRMMSLPLAYQALKLLRRDDE